MTFPHCVISCVTLQSKAFSFLNIQVFWDVTLCRFLLGLLGHVVRLLGPVVRQLDPEDKVSTYDPS